MILRSTQAGKQHSYRTLANSYRLQLQVSCLLRWFWSQEKNCFTNCFVIFSIYVDKIIFYRHYCCYAGDCSPRLHVTLGHSGEPGESNGCSEVPSAYYNTNSILFDFVRLYWFDWFENRTHSKIGVRFCSIAQPNRTIGVRLGSIGFLFGFVRLDRSGNPLHVILHCLVYILSFNVNNGDTAKSVLSHCGSLRDFDKDILQSTRFIHAPCTRERT